MRLLKLFAVVFVLFLLPISHAYAIPCIDVCPTPSPYVQIYNITSQTINVVIAVLLIGSLITIVIGLTGIVFEALRRVMHPKHKSKRNWGRIVRIGIISLIISFTIYYVIALITQALGVDVTRLD